MCSLCHISKSKRDCSLVPPANNFFPSIIICLSMWKSPHHLSSHPVCFSICLDTTRIRRTATFSTLSDAPLLFGGSSSATTREYAMFQEIQKQLDGEMNTNIQIVWVKEKETHTHTDVVFGLLRGAATIFVLCCQEKNVASLGV